MGDCRPQRKSLKFDLACARLDGATGSIHWKSGRGRVFLFLRTDDFWRDCNAFTERGVELAHEPKEAAYGLVAVFKDLYGNLWDLLSMEASGDLPLFSYGGDKLPVSF